jgi:hypothetical protein
MVHGTGLMTAPFIEAARPALLAPVLAEACMRRRSCLPGQESVATAPNPATPAGMAACKWVSIRTEGTV